MEDEQRIVLTKKKKRNPKTTYIYIYLLADATSSLKADCEDKEGP